MSQEKHAPSSAQESNRRSLSNRPTLFGNLRILCAAAILAALSIVFGKYLAIPIGSAIRISFENLPILMAGVFFGPLIGGAVGAVADIVGCLMVGYDINPFITVGAALIGVVSGLVVRIGTRRSRPLSPPVVCLSVMLAHAAGSMTVKSIGMAIWYGTPIEALLWRIPLYTVIGALECTVLILLARNKNFTGQLARLLHRKKGRK